MALCQCVDTSSGLIIEYNDLHASLVAMIGEAVSADGSVR